MSKKMRNLEFLNKQVIAVTNGHHPDNITTKDALVLLCDVSPCAGWHCSECPVNLELSKVEKEKKRV